MVQLTFKIEFLFQIRNFYFLMTFDLFYAEKTMLSQLENL